MKKQQAKGVDGVDMTVHETKKAVHMGIPVPGLMTAPTCWDAHRSSWLPANLIIAQRDYFGSHTYERVDAQGSFHTRWAQA